MQCCQLYAVYYGKLMIRVNFSDGFDRIGQNSNTYASREQLSSLTVWLKAAVVTCECLMWRGVDACGCCCRCLMAGLATGCLIVFNIDFNKWHHEYQEKYHWRASLWLDELTTVIILYICTHVFQQCFFLLVIKWFDVAERSEWL